MQRTSKHIITHAVQGGTLRALHTYHQARAAFRDHSGLFTLDKYIATMTAARRSLKDKGNHSRARAALRRECDASPYLDALGGGLYRVKSLRRIMHQVTGHSQGRVVELPGPCLRSWPAFLDFCVGVVAGGTHYKIKTLERLFFLSRRRILQALARECDAGRLERTPRYCLAYFPSKAAAAAARDALEGLHKVFTAGPYYVSESHGWALSARSSNKYTVSTLPGYQGIKKKRKAATAATGAREARYFATADHLKKARIRPRAGEDRGQYIARKVAARQAHQARRDAWADRLGGEVLAFGPGYNLAAWAFENSRTIREACA